MIDRARSATEFMSSVFLSFAARANARLTFDPGTL